MAAKESAGVSPNLHPEESLPEVQNRGISGTTKKTYVPKKYFLNK